MQSKARSFILLDYGASKTLINVRVLPQADKTKQLANNRELSTIASHFSCSSMIKLFNLTLPEFDKNCTILEHNTLVLMRTPTIISS